jgi:hypothetical protein
VLDQLTFEQMKGHVGTVFRAQAGDGKTIDLKLSDARKVTESDAARLRRTPFSLYFDGPPEPFLEQRIYRLQHDAFSEPLDIFLVPIKKAAAGFVYEAVFT